MTNTHNEAENGGQIIRRREGEIVEEEGGKKSLGRTGALKDVKNEGTSGDVHENKGPDDNLPNTKDDICAWLHVILLKNAYILPQPSARLQEFERWTRNRSLQDVEPREVEPRSVRLASRFPVDSPENPGISPDMPPSVRLRHSRGANLERPPAILEC